MDYVSGLRHPYPVRNATSPTVAIGSYGAAERFLERFGSAVSRLQFESEADQNSGIWQFVEHYSVQSLQSLKLFNVRSLSKTFDNVHSLHLRLNVHDDDLQLNRRFPNLNELRFQAYLPDTRYTTLEQAHPHLTRFEYDCERTADGETTLRHFVRANPQLRRLAVTHFVDHDMLAVIRDSLPLLDELSLIYSRHASDEPTFAGGRTVRFDSVRKFTVCVSFYDNYSDEYFGISFGALDELEILTTKFAGLALRLVEANRNLKRLSVGRLFQENSQLMANVVLGLRQLEEVVVPWSDETTQESVARIMDGQTNLTTVTFAVFNVDDPSQLYAMVSPQWKLAGAQEDDARVYNLITFTRL